MHFYDGNGGLGVDEIIHYSTQYSTDPSSDWSQEDDIALIHLKNKIEMRRKVDGVKTDVARKIELATSEDKHEIGSILESGRF